MSRRALHWRPKAKHHSKYLWMNGLSYQATMQPRDILREVSPKE